MNTKQEDHTKFYTLQNIDKLYLLWQNLNKYINYLYDSL